MTSCLCRSQELPKAPPTGTEGCGPFSFSLLQAAGTYA